MLKSIHPSAFMKLSLAICLVVAFGAAVPVFSAQSHRALTQITAANPIAQVNDEPTVQFGETSYSVSESGSSISIEVTLSNTYSNTVTVDYATSPGSTNPAAAGSDYTTASGTLTFAPEDISETFNIPILSDTLDEPNETVNLTLSNPSNASVAPPNPVTLTITDDDNPPTVQFSQASYTTGESGGSATITVQLSTASGQTVTVNYATSPGTTNPATAGSDYTTASGQLTFVAGDTSESFTVPILSDTIDEPNETVSLTLSTPSGATLGTPNPGTLTITDDDTPPTVQFSQASYTVGESDGSAMITVQLSTASGQTVTVNYATSPGATNPATAGSDYTTAGGQLTFIAGDTSESFTVPILSDTIDEPNETVSLSLSAPGGATLGTTNPATLSITDDDAPPTVRFSQNSYSVNENAGTATIEVELSAPSGLQVSVDYATSNGTATAGSDYTASSGTLTFAAGDTSETFPIPILDDINDEPDESIGLSLSLPSNATLGSGSTATLFITDNDDPPTVEFDNTTYSVNEGQGTATITVTLSAASGRLVTVDYATSPGPTNPATAGSDYTALNNTLAFQAGQTSRSFTVPINDDALHEPPSETVSLTLSNPNNATLGTRINSVLSIVDNDGPTTVQFNPTTINVDENAVTATVNVVLSAPSGLQVSVNYATSDGTATAGSDYTATNGTLVFAPGEISKSFSVPVLMDQINEPDETVNLALTNPVNAQLGAPNDTAVLTIVDTSDTTTVLFSQSTYTTSESALTSAVTVTLSAPSAFQVAVDYVTGDGTATFGDDYAMTSGTLVFAPGQVSQSFTVPILSDELNELDETVTLSLSNPMSATLGVPSNATLVIQNDDPLPAVRFTTTSLIVSESEGVANVAVGLDTASGRTVTVDYVTVDQTAVAGSDYATITGTLVFTPGETSKTISVSLVDDNVDEPDETFGLTLSAPGNATLGTANSTVTIVDSDLPIFRSYYTLFFISFAVGEPNDSCGSAYEILPSRPYPFLPDDRDDWYQFNLDGTGNLIVEVTGFVPLQGQVAVYKGDSCGSVTVLGNYGASGTTKTVDLGPQTAGHYYVYVSNDGPLNSSTPYQLHVRFP